MKRTIITICITAVIGLSASCGTSCQRPWNDGINIIPTPMALQQQEGVFSLTRGTTFYAPTPEAETLAVFFASKLKTSTGFTLNITDTEKEGSISFIIDPTAKMGEEAYQLNVTPTGVKARATTPRGLFYAMQSFLQLLPAEVESSTVVKDIDWTAPCVTVSDAPRFAYRGVMLDPCRHFIPVENVKKQLDVLSLFKINTFHWHLTDDQGWRIEIKKYPKLTEIGAKRIEGEGFEYGGFYTQDEIKDIVAYAAERFITVIPELEIPGHEMAAIAAYPELSCKGEPGTPRIIWGVEDVVMCPGKEKVFTFLEDVIAEMVPLFPGTYFHIGGDECPKSSWESCPACQARIKAEGLNTDKQHKAEERLQSYVVARIEKVLAGYGKKIIGWEEILEGGLTPNATVMSWLGESGGITSAMLGHDAIMTPVDNGLYLDFYQGDSKIEPVSIGGYTPLSKVYNYNPVPDTLVAMGKDHYIKGVQGNNWSEYMYTTDLMEYRMYPRMLAVAEIAWTKPDRKDYQDFERRIYNAYIRLDGHGINYHIPQPEQPGGSCNFVAFIDSTSLVFKTSRPEIMIYTLDGSEPSALSTPYTAPLYITENTTLKIRTLLPSGKMSPTRIIIAEKQSLAPAIRVDNPTPGLKMRMTNGTYLTTAELGKATDWKELTVKSLRDISSQTKRKVAGSMRGIQQYAAIATGYVYIPEDGVYFFSSNNDEVWIDGKLLIDNEGEVKRYSRHDTSVALAKGLHQLKVVFLGHIIGGWPSLWGDAGISVRKAEQNKFTPIKAEQLYF